MRIISKLIYNGILGGLALIALNLIGGLVGFSLPLNILTSFITGVLGAPGVILLTILKLLFNA
jgi:inhibitor of the pro-sigma K processing machinery